MNPDTTNGQEPGDDGEAAPQGAAAENAREWPVWAAAVLESMRQVGSISRAAKTVGIDRRTIQRLQVKDERFAVALADARDEMLDSVEEVLLMRARTGQPTKVTVTKTLKDGTVETTVTDSAHLSDTAAIFLLKRWRPEYRDTFRAEVTGAGGGPVQVETIDALDRRIAELSAELSAAARHGRSADAGE